MYIMCGGGSTSVAPNNAMYTKKEFVYTCIHVGIDHRAKRYIKRLGCEVAHKKMDRRASGSIWHMYTQTRTYTHTTQREYNFL